MDGLHEALCRRCGACCHDTRGVPCEHLKPDGKGRTLCGIYGAHLGPHSAVDGKAIVCRTIEAAIVRGARPPGCAYVEVLDAIAAKQRG